MRRFALIALALLTMFTAFAVTSTAEAGGFGRPGYGPHYGNRAHMMRMHKIGRNKNAAAALAVGLLGVAAIGEAIAYSSRAYNERPDYYGIRSGGVVVAHNPDYPHVDGYANPCTFERVTDFYGRPTSRVVKVCR